MCCWDKNIPRDLLIANIPENIENNNIFDINFIRSHGGSVPY